MADTAVIEDRKLVSFNPIRTRRDALLWGSAFVVTIVIVYLLMGLADGFGNATRSAHWGGFTGFSIVMLINLVRHQSMTAHVSASFQPLLVAALEKAGFRKEATEGARLVFLPKRPTWNRFDAETVVLERAGDRLEISAPRYVMRRFRKALNAG